MSAPTAAAEDDSAGVDLTSVARLFDPAVVVAQARTDELSFHELPAPACHRLTGFNAELRQRTFTAGRLAAARATAALGGHPYWLDADDRGAPVWPPGSRGSLSHTNTLALCVTSTDTVSGLGIDIEPLDTGTVLHTAQKYVCTPAERVRTAAAADPAHAVLRVFCAKEALYKALSAAGQREASMLSVELIWSEPDAPYDPVTLIAVNGPAPGAVVRCAVLGSHMVAAVTLP